MNKKELLENLQQKHIYAHFDLIDGKLGNPFYIGISQNPHSDPKGIFIGAHKWGTSESKMEHIKYFLDSPYIRRCDFGENSYEGKKANITFSNPSHKCKEYTDYLKDKKLDIDYTTRVIFESDDWDLLNFMEYVFVNHFGFKKNGGLLFNKISGGYDLKNGILEKKFKYDVKKTKSLEPIIIDYFLTGKEIDAFIH